jgi:TrmH family RNA methyltransferase
MLTKAEIARIKSLGEKKGRLETGLFAVEGEKSVDEMLRSGLTVRGVYGLEATLAGLPAFEGMAGMVKVSVGEMERISQFKTPSKVLALIDIPESAYDPHAPEQNLVLALDDVQDPGNLGTIVRLADWFGIRDILCSPSTADAYNPKAVQASMGAIARVQVHYGDLGGQLEAALGRGVPVYGTFLDGDRMYSAKLSRTGIVVMGNEGKGISPEIERWITRKLFIPPYPDGIPAGESLNVAIATAIVCSEFRRRGIEL